MKILKSNPLNIIIGVLGLLIMITGFIFLQAGQAQALTEMAEPALQAANDNLPPRTVTVSGLGEVSARPDQALVRLGVETEAETAEQALTENNQNMQALIDVFRQAGVQPADIQTQSIQIWPRYSNTPPEANQTPEVVGYTARNTIQVRVRNLDDLGGLLDAAVAAGGNTIESISFEINDRTALMEQARQAAMEDARNKAQQLAALAEASLGAVITIQESGGVAPPVFFGRAVEEAQAGAVPIEPGSETVNVSVQVTWLLE